MWRALARKCVLPRLKSLHVEEASPKTTLALMVCLSSSIHRFSHILPADEVDGEYNVGTALDVLESHKALNPPEITIEDTIPQTSINQILSLQQLQILHLASGVSGVFDSTYVPRLSTLPHLKDLELRHQGRGFFDPVPVGGFPSLAKLPIVMNSRNARNILGAQPPQLSHLSVLDLLVNEGGSVLRTIEQLNSFLTDWRRCISALDYHPPLTRHIYLRRLSPERGFIPQVHKRQVFKHLRASTIHRYSDGFRCHRIFWQAALR